MSSNYPPGVTGNEWHIRGPDEATLERNCDQDAELPVLGKELQGTLKYVFGVLVDVVEKYVPNSQVSSRGIPCSPLSDNKEALLRWIGELRTEVAQLPTVEVDECPFQGKVDAQMTDVIFWECPVCGYEHEEDIPEYEPDGI